jgi:peptidoglycan hydrolase-like protein with peptidoglycan-binding domain
MFSDAWWLQAFAGAVPTKIRPAQIDGELGPQTRRAIAEYQKQNGLRVTASLDRQTRDSLLGTMGTGTPPASAIGMAPSPSQGGAKAPTPSQGGTNTHSAPSGGSSATGRQPFSAPRFKRRALSSRRSAQSGALQLTVPRQ